MTVNVNLYNGHNKEINCCCFTSDEKLLVTASDDCSLHVYNFQKKNIICQLIGHSAAVVTCKISNNDRFLASGSLDTTIKIWDLNTGDCFKTLQSHTKSVECVSFSKDDKYLASTSWDKSVALWDVEKGELIHKLYKHSSGVRSCCFSLNFHQEKESFPLLATGGWDNLVLLWKFTKTKITKVEADMSLINGFVPQKNENVSVASLEGHCGPVVTVLLSKDGFLASASMDCTIKLWNSSKAILLKTFKGHSGWISAICFSPNSLELVSASEDGTVRVWNVLNGENMELCQKSMDKTSTCFFSPSGSLFVAGSLYMVPTKSDHELHDVFHGR